MLNSNHGKIDLSYLHSVSGGDKTFEKMLLLNAVSDIQNNINNLQGAWAKRDANSVSTAAHTLKSVVAIAGIMHLAELCKKINIRFKDGIFRPEEESTFSKIVEGWNMAKPNLEAVITTY